MWIKPLDRATWISMKHITHFTIEQNRPVYPTEKISFTAHAHLDASRSIPYKSLTQSPPQDQTCLPVCRGTDYECEEFIKEQTF